ncbi:MAG: RNA polymerase factor sigma-54 [Bacteroides sp.]|nr:RNA polymerase factor sigma-54 [Bacteroides sp.]MCM1085820.1 RNA polymerase factor sigma-54 [Bacteroides sp.]
MALKLNQNLSQKLMQKLSPQQLQLMKLMQVTTMGLEQRVKEELQGNPALEEDTSRSNEEIPLNRLEEPSDEGHFNDDDSASDSRLDQGGETHDFDVSDYVNPDRGDYAYKLKSNNYRDPEDDYQAPVRFRQGFQEQLTDELGMLPLTETQRRIGEIIIGNLDQDGYLQRSVEAMVNDLAFSFNLTVSEREVEEVLQRIQRLEPSGIGGRDLRECLLIQLRNKTEEAEEKQADLGSLFVLQTARGILEKCFDAFVKRQYGRMAERLKVSEEDLREAIDLIKTLDPKPGRGGGEGAENSAVAVIPDFYLVNDNGKLLLSINARNEPGLRVSPAYEEMLLKYEREQNRPANTSRQAEQTREAAFFVKQKIDSARWFMEMIRQRRDTMLNTMQAIVDFQHDYFLEGDIFKLRPMRLKDIAGIIKMDVSTVSRVINNKYIQTHFGMFLVKKFFSQSIENGEGEEISTTQIKDSLKRLIENEDKTNPLTDDVLTERLNEQGFNVARRTVAKYREGLGFQVTRLRKQI